MPQGRAKQLGEWGETQACRFLERHGFQIVERNYYTPQGEIDIIATKNGDYYFVEVKTRRAGAMAYDTAITASKRYKMLKTVKAYCFKRSVADVGLILFRVMVIVDRAAQSVRFESAVLY